MSARKRALHITWREAWPIWLTFGLLFGFGALGLWLLIPAPQVAPKVLLQGEDAFVHVTGLQTNLPTLFAYPLESGGATEFFVERDARDSVTVGFVGCRRCYGSGHYRQGGRIICGRCNEPMERASVGQKPAAGKDCMQIPIPFERPGDLVAVRASTVGETFARWYGPVVAQGGNSTATDQK